MIPRDHVSPEARVIVVITPKGQFLKANRCEGNVVITPKGQFLKANRKIQ